MAQWGFHINTAVCTGCKACELACKDKHSFDIGPRARRVREISGGGWTVDETNGTVRPIGVFSYSVSYSCGHCDNPACVAVCPTGAHHKDPETGIVSVDTDRCIGCGSCVINCPYDAPQMVESEGVVRKCDLCWDLMTHGEEPACVAICPQRALQVGKIEDLRAECGDQCDILPLPNSEATHPNIVVTPHRNAQFSSVNGLRLISLEQ
ncbi:4Fe-4S dicluster domain-containing protein [Senegalimassilia anaerobia]|uniref:4Fe-4S ferredoxin n=1 Tax=Senegalimassilia anaerobia TaxID=1473216 RepID=A0A369LAK4_9ACTN|nr:4Fe-4S dicluster domain-containing protein [Senegalimassilia anaerobia]RDB55018.1 4Fe-4S ferredoxin [Senegalimassilia anaerobia]